MLTCPARCMSSRVVAPVAAVQVSPEWLGREGGGQIGRVLRRIGRSRSCSVT